MLLIVECSIESKVRYAEEMRAFLCAVLREFPSLFFDARTQRRVVKACTE